MSSWVVPAIAAELWGVSVEHVLRRVRAGELPAREEFGFLWVEVSSQDVPQAAPDSTPTRRVRGRWRRGRKAKATYVARLTSPLPAADACLTSDVAKASVAQAEEADAGVLVGPVEPEQPEQPDRGECESPEDPDDGLPMNWREARSRISATRRRPPGG